MWMTIVIALLIAWCVTSVPLALLVARMIGHRDTAPTGVSLASAVTVAPAVRTHDTDLTSFPMHRAS